VLERIVLSVLSAEEKSQAVESTAFTHANFSAAFYLLKEKSSQKNKCH